MFIYQGLVWLFTIIVSPDTAHILSALTLIALFAGVITVQCLVYSHNALPSDDVVILATKAVNTQMQMTGQVSTQAQELTNTIAAAKVTTADMQCAVKSAVVEASKVSEQITQKVLNTVTSAGATNNLVKETLPLSKALPEVVGLKVADVAAQGVAKIKTSAILESSTVCVQKSVSSSTQCADVLVDAVLIKNSAVTGVTNAIKKTDACTQTIEKVASYKSAVCAESLSSAVAGTTARSAEPASGATASITQVKKLAVLDNVALKPKAVDTLKMGAKAQDTVTLSSGTTVASMTPKTKVVSTGDAVMGASKTKVVSSVDTAEELKQPSVVAPLTRSARRALKKAAKRAKDKAAKQDAIPMAQQPTIGATKSVPESATLTTVAATSEKASKFSVGNLSFVDHGMEHAANQHTNVLTICAPAGSNFGKILNKMDTVSVVKEPISQLASEKLLLLQATRKSMRVKVIESLEEFLDFKPRSLHIIHCIPILAKSVAKHCTKQVVSLCELIESLLG